MEDSDIVKIARGDTTSFRKLYDELFRRLVWFVYRSVERKEIVEDIVQEAFVLFWEKRMHFDSMLAAKVFLYKTVQNKIQTFYRDSQNHKRILDSWEQEQWVTEDQFLIVAEVCGEVQHAVRELPLQTRRVITLSMQDLTIEKIAAEMNISPNTVKTLKKAGYQALRLKLGHLKLFFLLFS